MHPDEHGCRPYTPPEAHLIRGLLIAILTATTPLCNILRGIRLNFLVSRTIVKQPVLGHAAGRPLHLLQSSAPHTGLAMDDGLDLRQEEPDHHGRHRHRRGIAWNYSATGGTEGRRHMHLTRDEGRGYGLHG